MVEAVLDLFDPTRLLAAAGVVPDRWQRDLLVGQPHRAVVCTTRQAGKTLCASALAVHRACHRPGSLVIALSPTQRQSAELLGHARRLVGFLPAVTVEAESTLSVTFANGSRVVALPGATPDTIRGYSAPDLLIIDEAAYVSDVTIDAARPSLAVSDGDLIAMSTPAARSGWFYRTFEHGGPEWVRYRVRADEVERITPEFLSSERASMTEAVFRREYMAAFVDAERSVFGADLVEAALVDLVDRPIIPTFGGTR